jgi:4-amino-4-deoxy-L-arabinose transferase-like glycosyltransferase
VNLVENRVFSTSEIPPYIPHTFTTPIYPLFLSLVYAIFGQKPYITILLQNIIGSIICVLTLKIGNKLFDEKTAFWAGLLVAFEYSSISLNELLATDTLFTFLFMEWFRDRVTL